jgi:hypothetical protein
MTGGGSGYSGAVDIALRLADGMRVETFRIDGGGGQFDPGFKGRLMNIRHEIH